MNKIVWRLQERPSTEALRGLVKDGILTKEQAQEILFTREEVTERSKESLEEEIKFLRMLIDKLSQKERIIETIREVEVPWRRYDWYTPYRWYSGIVKDSDPMYFCGKTSTDLQSASTSINLVQTF